jgi:hypothetical protein
MRLICSRWISQMRSVRIFRPVNICLGIRRLHRCGQIHRGQPMLRPVLRRQMTANWGYDLHSMVE